jgi:hypothetical protein
VLKEFGYPVIEVKDVEEAVRFSERTVKRSICCCSTSSCSGRWQDGLRGDQENEAGREHAFHERLQRRHDQQRSILEKDLSFIAKPASSTELLRKVREAQDRKNGSEPED